MRVVLERPVTWLESKRDGDRNRLMYTNLLRALCSMNAEVTEVDTHYGSDLIERTAPPNGILISYHSVGQAENVLRLKETSIPFFYNFDRLGYSGWSELSIEREKYEKIVAAREEIKAKTYCNNISNWLIQENLSKYTQSTENNISHKGFILFPMQILTDAVAVHNRIDPLTVLHEATKYCKKQKKLLLIKRHPYCTSNRIKYHLLFNSIFNEYVRTTTASITSLLSACEAVLVGNSGVGLEAIIYGKPVYSFARSEYDMAAYQIRDSHDIASVFSASPEPHPNGYKFGHYFLKERCFDARNPDDILEKLKNFLRTYW